MSEPEPSPWNVPNALCVFRIAAAPVLAYLAYRHQSTAFAWLFGAMFLSDWLDGKIAILFDQRTTIGARLDSAGDAAMYAALLFGLFWMKWDVIRGEAVWLIAAVVSYAASCGAGLAKFGRIPSYHTRAAKTCWLLIGLATISVFAEGPVWPLRVAAIAGLLTNLEGLWITRVLPEWRANVRSIYHVLRDTRRAETGH
ncbi:MAG: CDP-alcohol phosphatidyltransferase family protein [Planctomycetota bacterium]|nr:CDP-alcohol phosphatidyltransferase family protein [Planctomycetota bacterium]